MSYGWLSRGIQHLIPPNRCLRFPSGRSMFSITLPRSRRQSTFCRAEPFTVVTASVPGEERLATLHLSMSDATGDSAIIEYIEGKQVIHHDRKYQVMTNSPAFEKQLALDEYWKSIGGAVMLPGTNGAQQTVLHAPLSTSTQFPKMRARILPWRVCSALSEMFPFLMGYRPPTSPISLPHAGALSPTRREGSTTSNPH